jgi:L-ascorbate metabolism protein UlaG (beta-lactamase superfamily)
MTYLDLFETDHFLTSAGELAITCLGHGSLLLGWGGKQIYIDPFSKVADYGKLPKADLVLITHEHGDHLDPAALKNIRTPQSVVVLTQACAGQVSGGIVMSNGDTRTVEGIPIEAVPAYNIKNLRPNGQPFHPKGAGNGYVLTFGDVRVYIGGDTEDIPEMAGLMDITIAFLPMNLPYTMTPELVAKAAKGFRPKVLYPYHYGDTDPTKLTALLKDTPEIEVKIRRMA